MAEFSPNPNIRYVAHLEDFPRQQFSALPPHPAQRQTELHAVNLAASGVLDTHLDQHCEVAVVLIGDPAGGIGIEQMIAEFGADPFLALAQYAVKLNGHTRDYLWNLGNGLAAPDSLRLTVYAAADKEAAAAAYRAVDSLTAVKGRKDTMQSTLRVAGIVPRSPWLLSAGQLAPALDLALAVVCGSQDYRPADIREVLRRELNPTEAELRMLALLPHLSAVLYFKDTLALFDALEPSARLMPMLAPFVAGYLSILHRDPAEGRKFLEALQTQNGYYAAGLMDSFYAVKKVADEVLDAKAMLKTAAAERTTKMLACTLNAYEGWRNDTDFKADKFPMAPGIIVRFNPVLAQKIDGIAKAADDDTVKAKQRRATARRQAEVVHLPPPPA